MFALQTSQHLMLMFSVRDFTGGIVGVDTGRSTIGQAMADWIQCYFGLFMW